MSKENAIMMGCTCGKIRISSLVTIDKDKEKAEVEFTCDNCGSSHTMKINAMRFIGQEDHNGN